MNRSESTAAPAMRRGWAAPMSAVLGYVAAVLAFAWPLPLHLADRVVLARGSDLYPHIWNLWWMRHALLNLHENPYFTTYLNYPTGMPLTYHVLDPLDGLLSIPLQSIMPLVAAFNILRLAQMVFAAGAACALCRTLRLSWPAAWAGGALFAFCPLVGTSFDFGQLVEISVGWIPLYILCLIKGLGNHALGIPPARLPWLLGAGLALAASALSTWYFFTALVLFTALYVAWEAVSIWRAKSSNTRTAIVGLAAKAAAVGTLAVLVLSPLIVALVRESANGASYTITPELTIIKNSADLLSFFVPMSAHVNDPTINPHGSNPALGWIALALAILGFFAWRHTSAAPPDNGSRPPAHRWFWPAVAITFALLALGPHLLVAGNDTGFPMPYTLLNKLPFIGAARVPLRFVLLVSLAVAVLGAYGVAWILRAVRQTGPRAAILAIVALLFALEVVGVPRTMFAPTTHPFYATIAATGAEGAHDAVMELPQSERAAPAMYGQSAHKRPIIGGYTARHYPYPWIGAAPGVPQLADNNRLDLNEDDIVSPPARETALRTLDYYGVRYVTVYPFEDGGEENRVTSALDAIFGEPGIQPIYSDPGLTAYKVPPQQQTGPLVGLGEGWHARETAGGRVWRWTTGRAQVLVTNPLTATLLVTLRLDAYSLAAPRTMVMLLDGQEIDRRQINPHPSQPVALPLNLTPGEHWLELQSPEPPDQPPGDARKLSLGFERLAVERR